MTQHTRSTRHTLATAAGAGLVVAVLGGGLAIWVGLIARSDTRDATLGWLVGYIAVAYLLDRITVRLRDPRSTPRILIAALLLGAGLIMTNWFIAPSGLLFGGGTAFMAAAAAVLAARRWR